MDKEMFDKCSRASFIKVPYKKDAEDWARVDGFDPDEKKLYVHDEESGEEFSFEAEELKDAVFYELKEIK